MATRSSQCQVHESGPIGSSQLRPMLYSQAPNVLCNRCLSSRNMIKVSVSLFHSSGQIPQCGHASQELGPWSFNKHVPMDSPSMSVQCFLGHSDCNYRQLLTSIRNYIERARDNHTKPTRRTTPAFSATEWHSLPMRHRQTCLGYMKRCV